MNVFPDNVKCAFTNIVNIPEDMNDDWEVGITDIYLNNYIKYTPNQDKNVVEETEFVRLVYAETFRYKNVSVQTNIPENELIFIYTDIIKPRSVVSKRPRCLRVLHYNGKKKIFNLKILNIIIWTYGHQMKSQY